jgi:hypothetical protein
MKILDIPKSGKCGQVVAFRSRYGLCLRQLICPRNISTPARQHMRAVFGHNSQMWSGKLTQEQRDRWNYAGPQAMSHPRLSQKGPLTGPQFWQAINSVRGRVGLPPTFDPPAPVAFSPSVVGRLVISNDNDGVRLWLPVSGELKEDVMVFGQEPCNSGRSKRRNVCYLGLLPPPIGGMSEITDLYKARFGEPRPGMKVFIVTCQTKDGWKGLDQGTNEIVPPKSEGQQAPAETVNSQNLLMHKGGTRDAQGILQPAPIPSPGGDGPGTEGEKAAVAAIGGGRDGKT